MEIKNLIWDKYIYPRNHKSDKTIDAYVEAMGIGAEFPLIEVQHVSNYPNGDTPTDAILIIDGVHRWLAYQKHKIEEIEVKEWQPGVVLDYEASKIDMTLEAAERNTRHGDRIKDTDKEAKSRQIANDDLEHKYTNEHIGNKIGATHQRVAEWIEDIRTRQKASRDSKIVRLSKLGWTHEKIAKAVRVERTTITKNVNNSDFGKIHIFLSEGRNMNYIADYYHMDLALAWALRMDGMTDQERFGGNTKSGEKPKELGWGLRTWDDWRFEKCDPRFGDDWPGRIPAQLVAHTLFYFTKQGDLVLDPMAGGGVVPDVCLAFNRKCQAFDIVTRPERPEIEGHHWQPEAMTWPDIKKPDLIFFDPPYFSKKDKEYEAKAGEDISISSLSRNEYLAFFAEFFKLAHGNTKPTTRMAFLNADWRDFQSMPALEEKPDEAITILDYARLLQSNSWQVTHIIDCPMSSQRFNEGMVSAMQKSRILGVVRRTLLVARRA